MKCTCGCEEFEESEYFSIPYLLRRWYPLSAYRCKRCGLIYLQSALKGDESKMTPEEFAREVTENE